MLWRSSRRSLARARTRRAPDYDRVHEATIFGMVEAAQKFKFKVNQDGGLERRLDSPYPYPKKEDVKQERKLTIMGMLAEQQERSSWDADRPRKISML